MKGFILEKRIHLYDIYLFYCMSEGSEQENICV